MINNTEFNCASASSSECVFDKNVFCVENGLAKRQKKDSKSHGKIAADQMEAREKKIAEAISQLPKKMRAKLAENVEIAVQPGKTKIAPNTKVFHNRQKLTQTALMDDYEDHCLAEDDAHNEAIVEARDEAYEKHWAQYIEAMNEEAKEQEEARYQAYLDKKYLWDFPKNNMSEWDLMFLKDELDEYDAEFDAKHQEKEQTWKVIYEDHKYELEQCRSDWTAKELEFFQEKVDEYEAAHGINQKCEGESIWLEYGLTKDQYEAHQEYLGNCGDLTAFYLEPDYASNPDYENRLKDAIKKYEDEWNAQIVTAEIAEDNNDWWMDEKYAKEAAEDDVMCISQEELETYSEPDVTYEDWLERKKEEEMDNCRQEMREFLNDDY